MLEKKSLDECIHDFNIYVPGCPWQSVSIEVDFFLKKTLSYFCALVLACSPCHGNEPRRKYIST